jgi:uncharacterized protein with NAD-binding domain and iron-sulfur cluster
VEGTNVSPAPTPPPAKKKVAILGGGVAAVTVALQLTEDPNWRDTFESITIYQLGWRLGGKGATGRVGPNNRILEHGLHVWLGYYENAFQLIQTVYQDAKRLPGAPLQKWEQAFTGQNYVGVDELYNGRWVPWMLELPVNNRIPGEGTVPSLRDSMQELSDWIGRNAERSLLRDPAAAVLGKRLVQLAPLVGDPAYTAEIKLTLSHLLTRVTRHRTAADLSDLQRHRLLLLTEMAIVILFGLLTDGIYTYGDLEKLEHIDFAHWLGRYNPGSDFADLKRNPLLRGMYDFAFAFENGEVDKPNFAAAPALRTIFRMVLTYKGSIFWKMNAGMGDTIFAPAYQALRNRGVDIRFFHKVKRLELSADKTSVARIHIGRQATLKTGTYDPLVPVFVGDPPNSQPLPCWPSEPCYDQLVEGKALCQGKVNLESFWTTWRDVEDLALEAGKDFDVAVFGISLGSVPYLCKELMDASPKWADMATKVTTVRTQALQLWLKPDIAHLGWTEASPVMDAWIEPLDTWGDMTDVMACESWSNQGKPGSLAYFCGPMVGGIPDQGDAGFPAKALADVQATADQMLSRDIGTLWPALGAGGLPGSDVVARYDRANIDPSERYVQSPADTAKYRLAADKSGFANLVITGDWIDNGYNAGCVEASVWSGIQAANTIQGLPLNQGVKNGDSEPLWSGPSKPDL